jgi:hypothetical protein
MAGDPNLTPFTEDESYKAVDLDNTSPSGKTDGYLMVIWIIIVIVACAGLALWVILK